MAYMTSKSSYDAGLSPLLRQTYARCPLKSRHRSPPCCTATASANVEMPGGVFWLDKKSHNTDVVYGQVTAILSSSSQFSFVIAQPHYLSARHQRQMSEIQTLSSIFPEVSTLDLQKCEASLLKFGALHRLLCSNGLEEAGLGSSCLQGCDQWSLHNLATSIARPLQVGPKHTGLPARYRSKIVMDQDLMLCESTLSLPLTIS